MTCDQADRAAKATMATTAIDPRNPHYSKTLDGPPDNDVGSESSRSRWLPFTWGRAEGGEKSHYSPNLLEGIDLNIDYTPEEEARVVRKVDWIVIPPTMILYTLSFLDRSNIGNAKIDGLVEQLKIKDYPTLTTIYFIGYVLAEIPSAWGLKVTSPPFWLPTITLIWGIISVCMGLVHNSEGMYAARFFLGIAEAGLFPSTIYLYSRFYRRKERPLRVQIYFGGAAVAGSLGGVLAWAISKMDGLGGKSGAMWIFIIEGLLTVVVSVVAYAFIPNYPDRSRFFTERERAIIIARLAKDSDAMEDEKFSWKAALAPFKSLQVYGYCFLFHGYSFALYTFSLTLPSIINDLGYASWKAQLMTTPPYAFAFITMMTCTWVSTHLLNRRAPIIIACSVIAIAGYITLITAPTIGGRYVGVFIIAAGVYTGDGLLLAWPSENLNGHTFRATALAMVISIGNLGAVIGTELYRIPLGSIANKNYKISHIIAMAWLVLAIASAFGLWIGLTRQNRRLDRIRGLEGSDHLADEMPSKDDDTSDKPHYVGDWRYDFRYQT